MGGFVKSHRFISSILIEYLWETLDQIVEKAVSEEAVQVVVVALEEEAKAVLEEIEREDLLRCMMLSVINVRKNVKFHLNLLVVSLFCAVTALEKRVEVLLDQGEVVLRPE